jgi:capsule polysaccharide export protein KpsE/RkpR
MRALMIPQMIWSEGSGALGVGSLSNTQLSILDSSLLMVVQLIRDQLVEKVIRPLIYYNFGKSDDYGEFVYTAENDPGQEAAVTQGLMSALSSGLIQNTDYAAVNSLRERLKLPPIDPDIQMQQLQMQQQMQMMSQPPQMGNLPAEE